MHPPKSYACMFLGFWLLIVGFFPLHVTMIINDCLKWEKIKKKKIYVFNMIIMLPLDERVIYRWEINLIIYFFLSNFLLIIRDKENDRDSTNFFSLLNQTNEKMENLSIFSLSIFFPSLFTPSKQRLCGTHSFLCPYATQLLVALIYQSQRRVCVWRCQDGDHLSPLQHHLWCKAFHWFIIICDGMPMFSIVFSFQDVNWRSSPVETYLWSSILMKMSYIV